MLDQLPAPHRLRLIRFVCAFVWADRRVTPEERDVVHRFVRAATFDDEELSQIEHWLAAPSDHAELHLDDVSVEHRMIFADAVGAVILADGEISIEEESLFDRLLSWNPAE